MKKTVINSLAVIVAVLGFSQMGIAQPWIYDFGTGTGTANNANAGSGLTTFFTTTVSPSTATPSGGGTYRVRIGTGGGSLVAANPGTTLGTSTEIQLTAATGTSTNKLGVYGWTSPSTVAYLKFGLRTTATGTGDLVIGLGSGTIFSDNQSYSVGYAQYLAAINLVYSGGTLTTIQRRISTNAWTAIAAVSSTNFAKNTDQSIEIYANNGAASTNYTKSGTSYTLTTRQWDLWIAGVKMSPAGGWERSSNAGSLAVSTALDGFGFFGESSSTNNAIMYVDDLEYSNTLPTNAAPVANAVAVAGTATEGQTLTGSYTYSDAESNPEAGTTFKWYRGNDAAGTGESAISGATSSTYVLTSADVAKYIRFGVTPGASAGTSPGLEAFNSPRVGPVAALTPALSITANTTNNHGTSCPGTATAPLTYTVTNNGAVSAANITLAKSGADPADFAITTDIPPGTTITAGGSTTFVVTFTPSSAGSKAVTITANSSTSGTTTTGFGLTGTGTTPVNAVISTSPATTVVNTVATLNGNLGTLGVCPTTTAKGFVYAKTSDSPTPVNGGTGVTTSAAILPLAIGTYALNVTGLTPATGYSYRAYLFDGTTYIYGVVQTFTTLSVATQLAFGTTTPSTGSVGSNLTTFTVQARRADNSIDVEYTGAVNLTRNIISGSANLTGTTSVNAVAGVATFSAVQFDAIGTYTITASSGAFAPITGGNIVISLANAPINAWINSGASTAWCTNTNWNSSSVPATGEVAQFNNAGTSTTSGMSFSSCAASIDAIEVTSARTRIISIGSSSSTSGTLTLTGGVVNSIPNIILRNGSGFLLTLQPTISSSGVMAVALGNTTNNIIQIDGAGGILISSVMSGSNPLTKIGTGTGILQLTGANTYTGLTTVTEGTLQLSKTGGTTIPVTNSITINGGTLKVTTSQAIANLTMSSGSLVVDAGATLTVTGSYNVTGGTINNLGTLNLNGGSYNFPGTGVTINNGTAGTLAALTIASTGTVTMSADITVSGSLALTSGTLAINGQALTLGGAVTRTSGNLAGGNTSRLVVAGTAGSLFFDATGINNYLKSLTVNTGASATLGNALNITSWDGTTNPDSTGVLTVTGTGVLTTGGFLTLKSSANGTARVAPNTSGATYISGDVTVERYIRQNGAKGWRLLASNTNGSQSINAAWQEGQANSLSNTAAGFGIQISSGNTLANTLSMAQSKGFDTLSTGVALFNYNPATDGLEPITNTLTTSLSSQPGYFVFIRGDRRVGGYGAGTSPTSATVLRSKGGLFMGSQTTSTGSQNFGLARNPYASRIDMRNITRGSSVNDAYQVWDPSIGGAYGVGGYQTFVKSGTDYITTQPGGSYGGIGVTNNFIESGAAFYIQSTLTLNNSITITEGCKVAGSNNFVSRPSTPLQGQPRTIFGLYANNAGVFDGVDGGIAFFDNAYSNAVDINDIRKSGNFGENFGLTRDNVSLVVERRALINNTDTLFFDMNNLRQIGYRLDIEIADIDPLINSAVLEDKFTNTRTVLTLGSVNAYNFIVTADAASKATDRFRVVFTQATPLPVNFVSIKAAQAGNTIAVEWKVANQVNTKYYVVEKSTDGHNFVEKGTVEASQMSIYNWMDENAVAGYNYYRIKSVDNNGAVKYSLVAKIQIGGKTGITVSPNPIVGNFINLQLNGQMKGKYGIRITNISGQVVYKAEFTHNGGNASQSFALSSPLIEAIYQLEVIAPDNSKHTEKLIVSQRN